MQLFTARILEDAARAIGANFVIEPEFGYVGYAENIKGKRFYFKLSALDTNNLGASKIASDKAYTNFFLDQASFPTIPTKTFFTDEWCELNKTNNNLSAALEYAKETVYPLIVKPNSRSKGLGVEKVYDPAALENAVKKVFELDNIALVQPYMAGDDYRIVVYNGSVAMAYRRVPFTIIGDGGTTIANLLSEKQKNIDSVEIIERKIFQDHKYDLDSVPEAGEVIQLVDNANLSTGGKGEDVTDLIHESYRKMATEVVHKMGLNFCGLDIITEEPIGQSLSKYVIVEFNAMPGLEHYSEIGQTQLERVKNLYIQILKDYFQN